MNYEQKLAETRKIADIFELAKEIVQDYQLAIEITKEYFGEKHPVAELAANINEFLLKLALKGSDFKQPHKLT